MSFDIGFLLVALLLGHAEASAYDRERTRFHFQPIKNWMNDPNGPLYYMGFYHLFYQYNPYGPQWGNITWAHAVSKDLIHWNYLEPAMVPDQWYDIKGVWSGSATVIQGKPILVYTGASSELVQTQNKAYPANPRDPLLRKWIKAEDNPMIVPPQGINVTDFRDPVTAWIGKDGTWRIGVGSQKNDTGFLLQYRSKDFSRWELMRRPIHFSNGTGMWECPDFYAVRRFGKQGVETDLLKGTDREDVKYVVKASTQGNDVYIVGDYNTEKDYFVPQVSKFDIGKAETKFYDHGIYYASKTFYDPSKKRRVVFGWIREDDAPENDIAKGWTSVQAIPRQLWLDEENEHALKLYPVEEVETLRHNSRSIKDLTIDSKTVEKVKILNGSQLDVEVSFDTRHIGKFSPWNIPAEETVAICNGTAPADVDQVMGPFGVKVLASADLQEQTNIFFKLLHYGSGWKTIVCNDLTRSSLASDAMKEVYGASLQVSHKEKELKLRILVDHSITETFAQGGKVAITARVYPQLDGDKLFVFNEGDVPVRVKRLTVWDMKKLHFHSI